MHTLLMQRDSHGRNPVVTLAERTATVNGNMEVEGVGGYIN